MVGSSFLLRCRSVIAKCAELYEIVPGSHLYLSEGGDNALYIVLSGSVKVEVWRGEKIILVD